MKKWLKNYLAVTKKEWNGMVVLIIVIALVLGAPFVYQLFHKDKVINFKDFDKAVAQLSRISDNKDYINANLQTGEKLKNPVMFAFNPNNLTIIKWKQLGLSGYQAGVIKHYEAKGGKFNNKGDLKKIYAISEDDYLRLEPYINISEARDTPKKFKRGVIIEINHADLAMLTELRGIGPSFAMRIISYRQRLGGYNNKEQLKEVFGMDVLKYQAVKDQVSVNPALISKLNINTISFNQLRIFPYLGYKQVNAIIEYRTQHGKYTSVNDLRNIVLMDERILLKIEPYLAFE